MSTSPSRAPGPAAVRRPQFLIAALVALMGPLLVFVLLRSVPDLDPRLQATTFHFWIVSLAAVVGLLAAAVVLRASVGRDDIWVFFAGLGLLSIGSVFLPHSLATENVLLGVSHPSFSTSPPTSARRTCPIRRPALRTLATSGMASATTDRSRSVRSGRAASR